MTEICMAYDRKTQFRTRKDTTGIYLFDVWHVFLRFGATSGSLVYLFGYDKVWL